MASDILIVDDEAGHPRTRRRHPERRGSRNPHGARQPTARWRRSPTACRGWSSSTSGCRARGSTGWRCSTRSRRMHPDLPVVMISGHGNIETAVSAIRRGAYDFIEKPFKADRLILIAERALETSKLQARGLRPQAAQRRDLRPDRHVVGDEPAAPDHRARRADQQPHHDHRPVRLRQGTGGARHPRACRARKTALRQRSMRPPSRRSAWRSNCSARNRTAASARSARSRRRIAAFSISTRSADMPRETQSKILRVLVDQQFERVGGTKRVKVDVRIISSTAQNLEGDDRRGPLPRGSVPPARRGAGQGAGACRAARGHSRTSSTTS